MLLLKHLLLQRFLKQEYTSFYDENVTSFTWCFIFCVFGVMFVEERGNGGRKCFSRIIALERSGCNFRKVSWCCGRVQSSNDVA